MVPTENLKNITDTLYASLEKLILQINRGGTIVHLSLETSHRTRAMRNSVEIEADGEELHIISRMRNIMMIVGN